MNYKSILINVLSIVATIIIIRLFSGPIVKFTYGDGFILLVLIIFSYGISYLILNFLIDWLVENYFILFMYLFFISIPIVVILLIDHYWK
jgi:hypothetical protein